ncbi:lipase family protein [Flavobacterium noncentrifugens]|uniref:Lipase (Class 3) n=1 Tax=Flavobacterium noncentrifugens TaxID=1128970 RepID=A0A1G8ZEL4_9FLAO|nr:hypothetical protein [Flavobacterium noncentrifugens]SDK13467.1 Lipase (class 3) [Flavobacterium noncentrifugens]
MNRLYLLSLLMLSFSLPAQHLKPGFDKREYAQLLMAFSRWNDSTGYKGIPQSTDYRPVYRAKVRGLANCWEMYEGNNTAVISIRGSVDQALSWMANFYAAMVPAKGSLTLSDSLTYDYHFAENPKAGVHVGWAASCGFLIDDVRQKIHAKYAKGIRDFIIFGHSQGAGIAFLMSAQLKYDQKEGKLPKDIQFKTYCSAAPKPGNLYFAYDYESANRNGWSYTVVNAADWVPEMPISIQSIEDLNKTNPFANVQGTIKKQPLLERPLMEFVYAQLTVYNRKAVKEYQTYLGKIVHKAIRKKVPGLENPDYIHSGYYTRCGTAIVLNPDEAYYRDFPDSDHSVLVHHNLKAYLYLLDKYD